ncbi:MAG: LysR family transcriptional regulator [Erysipelotrichaceae bacterium]|nr:LysR family transcriptional regulator [Erysipelotrichaceae bacterium]
MTIRHIRIFLGLINAECNTTHAAEQLHMTQPAVSLAIRELEEYYGVKLFDRIGRRLSITEAGKRFKDYALHISELFDDMEENLRDWNQMGILHIGASITIGSQFLPCYVKTFKETHPGADVRVTIAPGEKLENMLLNNELDFALVEGITHDPRILTEDYMDDHLIVVCAADGPFSKNQHISIEKFKKQRFLLREPGSSTREEFDRITEHAGFSVTPVWESVSYSALVNAVSLGLGIACLPYRMVVNPLEKGAIISISVEGLSFQRKFRIAVHKGKYLTPLAQEFIQLCKEYESIYPEPLANPIY